MDNAAAEFKKSGYVVLRNIVDKDEVTKLYEYTLNNAGRGNMNDGQVPGSPSFYQDKEVVNLQKKLLPKFAEAIQVKLLPVFCYNRIYRTGAVLRMHQDSARAEISVSINLGQKGDLWDLWLIDYEENTHQISLAPGDGLIYCGNKLYHWRGKLVNSDFVSQVMFHCVDKDGKNAHTPKFEIFQKARKRIREMFGLAY